MGDNFSKCLFTLAWKHCSAMLLLLLLLSLSASFDYSLGQPKGKQSCDQSQSREYNFVLTKLMNSFSSFSIHFFNAFVENKTNAVPITFLRRLSISVDDRSLVDTFRDLTKL